MTRAQRTSYNSVVRHHSQAIILFILIGTALSLTRAPATKAQTNDLVFAVIGDYGMDNPEEAAVAAMVAGWNPDLVLTTGDNYYNPAGGSGGTKYDESTGAYFCSFLAGITTTGSRCPTPGSLSNRFFPALGNHDYTDAGSSNNQPQTYLDYFELPGAGYSSHSGNERYYDFTSGPVHFFVLNSNPGTGQETDGVSNTSIQAQWLKSQLRASTAAWNIVTFHHPPYSSGLHGSATWMQWPFAAWGADAVFSGHDHSYERIFKNGIAYFINGSGGAALYPFQTPIPGSQNRYAGNWGAQKVTASEDSLLFEFYSVENGGQLIDAYRLVTGRPGSSSDDAEERKADGAVYLTSSDLELVNDPGFNGAQIVGLRFNSLDLPPEAVIVSAVIEFEIDEANTENTSLVFSVQAADDAAPLSDSHFNLSSRGTVPWQVGWPNVSAWSTPGEKIYSPNLASIVQQIANRPGWTPGSSIVILIDGSGHRTAVSYDQDPERAAVLRVGYLPGIKLSERVFLPYLFK